MTEAIVAGSLVVAALNGASGLLGGWLWYWGEPTDRAAQSFWVLLRIGQGSVLTLALAVGSLAVAGKYSTDHLFYVYALVPIAVGLIAEQLRAATAQTILDHHGLEGPKAVRKLGETQQRALVIEILHREMGVMVLSALVVIVLAVRAASTAHGF